MPFGKARYGANVIGFTNDNPCVITVDSTMFFNIGDMVIVANLVCDNTGSQLNGSYLTTGMTNNTLTIDLDSSGYGVYISGGIVSIQQQANPTPSNQSNLLVPLLSWTVFNQARGGGTIPYR